MKTALPLTEWGRWILADRATRPIAPGFTVTAAELKKRREEAAAPTAPKTLTSATP